MHVGEPCDFVVRDQSDRMWPCASILTNLSRVFCHSDNGLDGAIVISMLWQLRGSLHKAIAAFALATAVVSRLYMSFGV